MMTTDMLSPAAQNHLSEDALDAFVLGEGTADAQSHLACCVDCQARVAEFESAIAVFRQASLAWSESRSNTLARSFRLGGATARPTAGPLGWTAAGVLAAAAIAVSTGVHRPAATSGAAAAATAAGIQTHGDAANGNGQEEIAADNAMLAAIDSEISAPDAGQFSLLEYGSNSGMKSENDRPGPAHDAASHQARN